VPHLRRGFIAAKVGHFRGSENPDTVNSPTPSRFKGMLPLNEVEGPSDSFDWRCPLSKFSFAIFCPKIVCQAPKQPNSLKQNKIELAF
jgi:hypothetical protein